MGVGSWVPLHSTPTSNRCPLPAPVLCIGCSLPVPLCPPCSLYLLCPALSNLTALSALSALPAILALPALPSAHYPLPLCPLPSALYPLPFVCYSLPSVP